MIDENKVIERPNERLSFVQQLEDQINICRKGMNNTRHPLKDPVDTLESLLWARLKDDNNYLSNLTEINKKYNIKLKNLYTNSYGNNKTKIYLIRNKAKKKFKAIMIFIDKKNLMPIGEQNE